MLWLWIILALLMAGVAGYFSYRADQRRAVDRPWILAALRGAVVFLTALLLLAPVFTISKNDTLKPIVVMLQDNSRSIANALGADSTAYQKNMTDLIGRLSDDYKVVIWNLDGNSSQDSLFRYNNEVTDITTALDKVQEFYGTQNLGAVVLATDGLYNQGVNPNDHQLSKGSLYTIGIGDTTTQKDIRIARTYANKTVSLNNTFEIRADIVADKSRGYNNTIRVTENGNALGSTTVSINTDNYDRSVSFNIKADKAGLHHYVITAPAQDGEVNTTNNRRDVFVEVVDEQKHILIAGYAPHPDIKAITSALSGLENYKITVRTGNDLPSLLDDYDILILQQLPGRNYKYNPTLQKTNKPIWYILGPQSDNAALTTMKKPAALNINPQSTRYIYSKYNRTFNAFTLPKNIAEVTDKMPPLLIAGGMIKPFPQSQTLFTDKGGNGTPLWTLLQGKTPTAMLTADGLWRWRMYEYKNFGNTEVIDECIRKTVAFLSTADNKKTFRVTQPKYIWNDQEAIYFNAYVLNANGENINEPEVTLTISDSSGNEEAFSFERSGSNYQLNIGVRAGGTYMYVAKTQYGGRTHTETGSFHIESIPLELMETGADYAGLYSLAQKNNGVFFTSQQLASVYDSITNNINIKPVIETNIETVPLIDRKWFFFLILLFAVAEWLLRKYWLAQ